MEPDVIRVMREFKARLLREEAAQMAVMARRYAEIEDGMKPLMESLAEEIAREGKNIDERKIYQMERYQRLLGQVQRELADFEEWAAAEIGSGQLRLARLGIADAATATQASYTGVGAFFDVLPVSAIQNMVGLAGDGSPLSALLRGLGAETAEAITRQLIHGTALGWNPRRVAEEMAKSGRIGLQRSLVIARTEGLRVYREAGRQQYAASGVVEGFYRLSAHDDRVCPACLMAEGEFYELDEVLREHPQGRCTMVPKVMGVSAPKWLRGADWFRQQDADTQRSILGAGRYNAWRDGRFDLDQLVTVRRNSTWGDSVQATPLYQLT